MGRYITGLLQALEPLAHPTAPASPAFNLRPLFAPRGAARAVRRWVKLLPGSYALAEAARAAVLRQERAQGLSVYHETNHAAPRFDGPVVLTVHDLSTLLHPETQEPGRVRHFSRALRLRAREATRVIVPTEAIGREVVQHLGVAPERVRPIHHGVDARFSPAPILASQAREPRQSPGGYLLFVGALDPRKGLLTLLDAYDALPARLSRAHPLLLAGPDDRASPVLRKRLAARRDGSIILSGYVSDETLVTLYRGAAAVCLPSIYEGFGLPLAEALACGVPSVASDDPALVEVAAGAALHFPRGDGHALCEALERLLGDESLRADLSRKGLARAAVFSWDACAAQHLAVYREAFETAGFAR